MASLWWLFGRGTSSSSTSPTDANLLHLSKTNVQRISDLTSLESQKELLNPNQCRSLSWKLVKIMQNIEKLDNFFGALSLTLPIGALENFYRVCEKAKELVENCCSEDWCQASTFQIQNEEAFKEILLETSLCYNTIFELARGISSNSVSLCEDLRLSSIFEPPASDEVLEDQIILLKRYKDFIDDTNISTSCTQKLYLAKHLSRRLNHIHLKINIEDFDVSTASLWPDGKSLDGEWGKTSVFLGGNVCKTTWLDVPCAKKVLNDGVQESVILAEAKILASLNHPNIVKFISCGHDNENSWHFLAMEHMEAGLHSVIRKKTQLKKGGAPFTLSSAVDIMLQIAYGTCYLHENGVAHRDLKTSNVVVRQITAPHLQEYYQVKLVDFGLSKVKLIASKSNTITCAKTGTTVYMPPEAFQLGRANWFKADVYSFGVLCSVLLSGEEPFQHVPRTEVCKAVCRGERPRLAQETPQDLTWLITKCWNLDRDLRPDFVEICAKLGEFRHKLMKRDPLTPANDLARRREEDLRSLFEPGLNEESVPSNDVASDVYIQAMIRKRSDAREYNLSCIRSQIFTNVIEEDEWFLADEIDLKSQLQGPSHIEGFIDLPKGFDGLLDNSTTFTSEETPTVFPNRRPFRCLHEGCSKTFKNPQTLKLHHKSHFHEDNVVSKGDVDPTLSSSLKAGHYKRIRAQCPKCKKTFVGLYELGRHYGRKHSEGEKPFGCRKCGKKFYIEIDVRDHEKLCGEPIQCKCGLKFAFRCNLVMHKKACPACRDQTRQTSMSSSPSTSPTNYQSSPSASDSDQSRGSSHPSNRGTRRQYEEIMSPMDSLLLPHPHFNVFIPSPFKSARYDFPGFAPLPEPPQFESSQDQLYGDDARLDPTFNSFESIPAAPQFKSARAEEEPFRGFTGVEGQ